MQRKYTRLRFKKEVQDLSKKTAAGAVHRKIHETEEDNVGVQAAHQSEEAVEVVSNPISRWRQRQAIKKEYKAARAAGTTGKASTTAQKAKETGKDTNRVLQAMRRVFGETSGSGKIILGIVAVLLLIVALFQSCSSISTGVLGGVSATSWPADDAEITKAEAYYVKLEAELQKEIYDYASEHSGSEEFQYDVGEIGHDPAVLISFLSAKYQGFTFDEIKEEINRLFQLQYRLDTRTETETRTTTKTVRVGESLGQVVTSGYCNCTICCGVWSGGPTASGVYPTANHTIAVDAYHPTLPMGTEIIMNGTLYKVEDTGNFDRYGVDFDVYYDSHSEASAHGHQTWEAYYAGGDGEALEVTTTDEVTVSYITLTSTDLEAIVRSEMNDEEKNIYDVYQETRGNRIFFGKLVDCNWHHNVVGSYGYRYDYASGRVTETEQMTISVPEGTEILSPINGTVKEVSDGTITLEDKHGYEIKLLSCADIRVSTGQTVENGQVIGKVGSEASFSLEFIYKGTHLNPYFYFEVGERELESLGTATGACATLIAEAKTHLGTPYVWGGYSPSGFDCSGFVSYCLTKSGALNTGHLTCDGLIARCRTISKSELQPGDLVFFQGTYETAPPSHVGIYIGSGVYGSNTFIHCGDPCKYGDLSSSYWIAHWYRAGRWY